MLLGGDELSRTQGGNNNAWCQDNEISWFDWELDERRARLLDFTRRVIALRREHPVFRRDGFFSGSGEDLPDVWWMRPDGRKMTQRDWRNDQAHAIGVFLNGDEVGMTTPRGEEVRRRLVPRALQRAPRAADVPHADAALRRQWEVELSTAEPDLDGG